MCDFITTLFMNYKELMYMYNEIGAEGEGGVGFILKNVYNLHIMCNYVCNMYSLL